VLIGFNAPLPANPGMENLFERLLFGGVLEDYRAKCGPIQVAIAGKDAKAEKLEQLLFDLLKIDKLTCDPIGVEKFAGGKNFFKTLAESALAGRNAARNTDCRHQLSAAAFCLTGSDRNLAIRGVRSRLWNGFTSRTQTIKMEFDCIVHFAFDLRPCRSRSNTTWQVRRIRRIAGLGFFHDDEIAIHFNPACLRILFVVPGANHRLVCQRL